MKLEHIIKSLSPDDCNKIVDSLIQTKADKYIKLFESICNNDSEKRILKKLGVSPSAYYTLRSRLLDKIQDHVYAKAPNAGFKLSKNIDNIDYLLYNSPKEIALSVLLKLEKELIKFDIPADLAAVYKALSKLHLNSAKHEHYIAENLKAKDSATTLEKAEDLLHIFNKNISNYWAGRNEGLLQAIIQNKREMNSYPISDKSHHLKVFNNILNIQFALHIGLSDEMQNDNSIEEMLSETVTITTAFPDDKTYMHLVSIINLLHFEYYTHSKLYKKAAAYFEKIKSNWMGYCYYNRSFFVANFYSSIIDYYFHENKENQLVNDQLFFICEQDADSLPDYIIAEYFKAVNLFYANKMDDAIVCITKLRESTSLKQYESIGMEIKLFTVLLYIKQDKLFLAESALKSIYNKISSLKCKELKIVSKAYFKLLHNYCLAKKNKKPSLQHQ